MKKQWPMQKQLKLNCWYAEYFCLLHINIAKIFEDFVVFQYVYAYFLGQHSDAIHVGKDIIQMNKH